MESLPLNFIVHNVASNIHSDFRKLLDDLRISQPDERTRREKLVRFFETR